MDKQTLIKTLDELERQWQEVIDELGPDGLEQPGANGEWSVRDVIAHCNSWERWQIAQVRCAFTGETPTEAETLGGIEYPANDDMSEDAMNAMFMEGWKGHSTDEVLDHWREVTRLRREWISQASQETLDTIIGADWASGTNRIMRLACEVPTVSNPEPVWHRYADQIGHQQAHLATINTWMKTAAPAGR